MRTKLIRFIRFHQRLQSSVAIVGFVTWTSILLLTPQKASPKPSEIVLTSPDGLSSITLSANDGVAGIWINQGGKAAFATMYVDSGQGPVVGVAASPTPQRPYKALDVALSAQGGAGSIQLVDSKNAIRNIRH